MRHAELEEIASTPSSIAVNGFASMAPRSRTFTGCGTCRARHLKASGTYSNQGRSANEKQCDEQRPFCGNCRRLGKQCRGYTSDLVYISERDLTGRSKGRNADETTALRYPLFTEDERSAMCRELVASTGGISIGNLVDQLDAECVIESASSEGLSKGPFHVFAVMISTYPAFRSSSSLTSTIDTRSYWGG